MKISVTREIIDAADRSVDKCICALALKAATGRSWRVGFSVCSILCKDYLYLPRHVTDKICDFISDDPDRRPEPFDFDLDIPAGYLDEGVAT
jgi:hypothetical protein